MAIISLLLVVAYVAAAIWRKRELPESISAMVWLLNGGWRWLWSVWLLAVDVLAFIPVTVILDGRGLGILGFLPMAMLAFVAVWPLYDTAHGRWHSILSVGAGVMASVDVLLISPWLLMSWGGLLLLAVDSSFFFRPRAWYYHKEVMIAESICALTVFGAVITKLIV